MSTFVPIKINKKFILSSQSNDKFNLIKSKNVDICKFLGGKEIWITLKKC